MDINTAAHVTSAQDSTEHGTLEPIRGGIIDFHAHIFPDAVAERAVRNSGDHYGIDMYGRGRLDELDASADTAGVSRVVLLSTAVKPAQVTSVNRWLAGFQNDRYVAFGALHPLSEDPERDFDELLSLGLHGVKLHPEFQRFDIDDPKMERLYRVIGDKVPIMMHVGDPRYDHSAPVRLRRMLDRHPELRIIAAHLGGYERWEEARESLIGLPIWLDTSSALWAMSPEEAVDLIRAHGVDRVVFGTDYPVNNHMRELALFNRLALTGAERRAILHGNGARLLSSMGCGLADATPGP